jgi:hypothetical protein
MLGARPPPISLWCATFCCLIVQAWQAAQSHCIVGLEGVPVFCRILIDTLPSGTILPRPVKGMVALYETRKRTSCGQLQALTSKGLRGM